MTLWHPLSPVNTFTFLSCVALPLDIASFLTLSPHFLFRIAKLHSSLNSAIYSLRLVEVSWLRSGLTHVGGVWFDYSWQGICPIGNSGNGIRTDFYLQNVTRQQYSLRQYQATGDAGCPEQTHSQASHNGPNMGLPIMYPKWCGLTKRFGLNFGLIECSSQTDLRPYLI